MTVPAAPVPNTEDLETLADAPQGCRACELWEGATQGVLGKGAAGARLMLVGEQPGDREDREGHPFVGPAGRILDQGLERAGISRSEVYATAGQALLGSQIRVGRDRGRPLDSQLVQHVTLTTHPSAILRSPDESSRAEAMDAFVVDLERVREWLEQ
jgi:uracil-DNA glycosylase